MPIDPFAPRPLGTEDRTSARIADLERRLAALEHGAPTIQVGTGGPASAPRDGTPYLEDTAGGFPLARLWLRVAGQWVYTDLN